MFLAANLGHETLVEFVAARENMVCKLRKCLWCYTEGRNSMDCALNAIVRMKTMLGAAWFRAVTPSLKQCIDHL